MKVSLNWLRDYVDFPGDAQALSELLTMAGVEVEGIETSGVAIDKVVVAQILASEQHPNADRLRLCTVDAGNGQALQVVCGAPNARSTCIACHAEQREHEPGGAAGDQHGRQRGVEHGGGQQRPPVPDPRRTGPGRSGDG